MTSASAASASASAAAASIRQAVSADIPAMSAIRLSVTENALSDVTRITGQMYEDFLERSGRGWVAHSGGEIAGFCYANKSDGSIWALFVRPGQEGQGFGKALLAHAVQWLFAIGHDRVHLTTSAQTRADRFYAAQGWQRQPGSGADSADIAYSLARPGCPAPTPAIAGSTGR